MAHFNPFEQIDDRLQTIESKIDQLATKPNPPSPTPMKYLTTDQVCELLSVSRVSLWSWDKKGITKPIRFGNVKRYRLSDIEALGNEGSE
jgi:hypothetical protein